MSEQGSPTALIPGKRFFFRAPPSAMDALRAIGASVASVANNHVLDFGAEALADTLGHLRAAGSHRWARTLKSTAHAGGLSCLWADCGWPCWHCRTIPAVGSRKGPSRDRTRGPAPWTPGLGYDRAAAPARGGGAHPCLPALGAQYDLAARAMAAPAQPAAARRGCGCGSWPFGAHLPRRRAHALRPDSCTTWAGRWTTTRLTASCATTSECSPGGGRTKSPRSS
jgi:Bacterial capsule synthesis protein PGA_cap